jgi:FMN-dependent NADH-azoreductase
VKLLHIASSPRGERSVSLKLADSFIGALGAQHADLDVDVIDVWKTDLLPFDEHALEAKYADLQGVEMTAEQKAVWAQIHRLGERFHQADVILFSVPMWNFGVPYRLKHLIDVVSQRGVLFDFDQNGMVGLLRGKKVVICASRGVSLGEDYPAEDFDHQVAFLRTWSRMVGIKAVSEVAAEATLGDADVAARNLQASIDEAAELARHF